MRSYTVQSPILLLIFNRPDTTQEVFKKIRAAKPARLYIAADGPRADRDTDKKLCEQARAVAAQVDWDCTVKTLFREDNIGCKTAVYTALEWFFEQEEEGIIFEDDCVPADSFFYFCDTMLEKYRTDTRIRHITGCNLQRGKQWGDASYYFSQFSNVWGWASWKRVWKDYDFKLDRYTREEAATQLKKIFTDPFLINDWLVIFSAIQAGTINAWDYQLVFLNFFENGLCITPNTNLVSNIGFRSDATNTPDPHNPNAGIPAQELTSITHPRFFLPEKEADYLLLSREFQLEKRWQKHNLLRRRFKRWLKSLF